MVGVEGDGSDVKERINTETKKITVAVGKLYPKVSITPGEFWIGFSMVRLRKMIKPLAQSPNIPLTTKILNVPCQFWDRSNACVQRPNSPVDTTLNAQ